MIRRTSAFELFLFVNVRPRRRDDRVSKDTAMLQLVALGWSKQNKQTTTVACRERFCLESGSISRVI